ncbi:SAM-dependent methyltransferase [Variovorax ureilyticus]|uniref:SAM-dependent methyltransferase n=1 Tax=Variovorax ureilyticus TaxID=1836198 RepID=A0ABU8VIZ0_9BURK
MNLEQGAHRANPLTRIIDAALQRDGGWLPFDRFMALALYAPGLGYYANASRKFGRMPSSGSDFVTAPELTPLFGRALAVQVAEALDKTGTDEIWEFGAGSGALALQLLDALGGRVVRYRIVDLSGTLRERQQQTLAKHAAKVEWLGELPESMNGVVVGNEVLDAMPVQVLARSGGQWFERGVVAQGDGFAWSDRPTDLLPPVEIEGQHDYLTEIHPQAEAFIATLADRLKRGAAFFFDYGFPESEYYHPQRHMGTVMCHRGHEADGDPLSHVGEKDITAHVNFTGIALAGQDAGLDVLGYCNQARFLLNAGILPMMEQATLAERSMAARLIHEHEMGELFKVVGFAAGEPWDAIGFAEGDRSHTL